MSLAAVREELDVAVAALPSPALAPSLGEKDAALLLGDLEVTNRELLSDLAGWRATMFEFEGHMRALLHSSVPIEGLRDQLLSQALAIIDSKVESAAARLELPAEVRTKMEALRPDAERDEVSVLEAIQHSYREAAETYLNTVVEVRDRLKALEWDLDPDARGGPAFASPGDLLSFLRS